jgi:hypothetical protein
MPILPWRNDADGFAFVNNWNFDATERAALTGIAQSLVIPTVAATVGAIIPDPIVITSITAIASAAAIYPATGPLPTYGMCGGMAYASLDYWHARMILPRGSGYSDEPTRATPASTGVRNMIWQRLLDSLTGGGVLQRTLEWSLLLNQVPGWAGGGPGQLLTRTQREWGLLRSHIDAGQPWPIGLVYTGRSVWDQHQILAYGYETTGSNTVTLYVYDSNAPSQYGATGHSKVTLDFSGSSLVATTPSDDGNMLAGFFCSNYVPQTPSTGLATGYGEFLNWKGDARIWMLADGARMPLADNAELTALGATAADVCATGANFSPGVARPRDGALFRERSDAHVYLYQGGAPFWIPDPSWLARFGGWGATRTVPDNTTNVFVGSPDEGTLLREWSDPKVYRIMAAHRRWVTSPSELEKYGGFPTVRLVPDGALNSIPIGLPLPPPDPGECDALRKQITDLTTLIGTLVKKLDHLDDPRKEAGVSAQLQNAEHQRSLAMSRASILQCPP